MKVEKWLFVEALGGDPWVLPIRSAYHSARQRGGCRDIGSASDDLGLHLSTRLSMLPTIYARVSRGATEVLKAASRHKPSQVPTQDHAGYALRLDTSLRSALQVDLDALLFEVTSACELMTRFFLLWHNHVMPQAQIPKTRAGQEIKNLLEKRGMSTEWFPHLEELRNFFIHEGAPWFAIDLSGGKPSDLLVMKKNLRTFDDPKQFLRFTQFREIVSGFEEARGRLQKYLIELLDSCQPDP